MYPIKHKFCKKQIWFISWNSKQQHIVHPPFLQGGGGWASKQIFKKGGLTRPKLFEGVARKEATFFRGGCNFDIKNKLKSGIFNDKKSL